MGSNLAYMRELAAYWRDSYDWREQERRLNALPQFRAEIDGLGIHFVHIEGKGPDPFPLIVSHGWPGSFFEMYKIAGPLTDPAAHGGDPADAFHLVVPSLIGYGFSDASREPGMTTHRMAELFGTLMIDTLGYERFGAQGGDWGSAVTSSLAEQYPANVAGIHLNLVIGRLARLPWRGGLARSRGVPRRDGAVGARRVGLLDHAGDEAADAELRAQRQSGGAGGVDRGEVAGVERLRRRRRAVVHQGRAADERDDLLGDADDQLVGAAVPGEPRRVRTDRAHRNTHRRRDVPQGDLTPAAQPGRAGYNVQRWTEMPRGGHFAAMEEPGLLVEDVRAFFRGLR